MSYALQECCTVTPCTGSQLSQVKISGPCITCKATQEVGVWPTDWVKFKDGSAVIQSCFPYLTPGEREFLLSGICDQCWQAMFANTDDNE
jgi:hypothetical protein